jgi:hypothetical protein
MGRPLTTASELEALMSQCQIRIVARKRQAQITAELLAPDESVVDVVKAYRVLVDGKRSGNGSGSALVFLTDRRVIVAWGTTTSLPLVEIASISDLNKGKFSWTRTNGEDWAFEHAQGIVHKNGNQANTTRFYEAMKQAVTDP